MNFDELLFLTSNIKILDVHRMDGSTLTQNEKVTKIFVLTRSRERAIEAFRPVNALMLVLVTIYGLR